MTLKIKEIADKIEGLEPGTEIKSVGSRRVEDQLDLIFHLEDNEKLELTVKSPEGKIITLSVRADEFEAAGITFEEMRFKRCGSNCIFCFVDQMPPGLRKSLYVKDDDYRFSFLYGNYVTLNDIKESEIDRVLEYNLSPLYVSIHAIDRKIREKLFGRPMRTDILKTIERLTEAGIDINAQVVLVPGVNDSEALEETLIGLAPFYPDIRSVAIVPVGLTKHRKGLQRITPFDREMAERLIDWHEGFHDSLKDKLRDKARFFYLSDEFYLLAERPLPGIEYYGEFDQISNGVGMSRLFIEDIKTDIGKLEGRSGLKRELTLVTGTLGRRLLDGYVVPLIRSAFPEVTIDIAEVKNVLFGREVTVSGLLGGKDIIDSLKRSGKARGRIVLPPNSINHEGLLIDDLSPSDIEREIGSEVVVPEYSFLESTVIEP